MADVIDLCFEKSMWPVYTAMGKKFPVDYKVQTSIPAAAFLKMVSSLLHILCLTILFGTVYNMLGNLII